MKYLYTKLVLFFLALALIPDSPAHADDAADVKKATRPSSQLIALKTLRLSPSISLLARPILAAMSALAAHSIKGNSNPLSQLSSTTT